MDPVIFLLMGMAFLMFWLSQRRFDYVCPQCGSKDGDHAKSCSFRDKE